jgi:hypothetical protein
VHLGDPARRGVAGGARSACRLPEIGKLTAELSPVVGEEITGFAGDRSGRVFRRRCVAVGAITDAGIGGRQR